MPRNISSRYELGQCLKISSYVIRIYDNKLNLDWNFYPLTFTKGYLYNTNEALLGKN
ncbi:MAG: hypothetical protein AB4372_24610 [Xenococcus sp. (in: cyanobacteria)]